MRLGGRGAIIVLMRPPFRALVICCLVTVVGGYFLGERQRQHRRYDAWRRDRHVHAVLSEPVRILFPDADHCTLLQAVELLRKKLDVPIDLESRLAGTAISPRHLVSPDAMLRGIYDGPLDEVLEKMLYSADDPQGVGYQLKEGRIVISRRSDYAPAVLVREYETPTFSAGQLNLDERDIVHLITTCIEPDTWDDVGGPYTAIDFPGAVTVAASSLIHRRIALMLRQLAALPAEPVSLRPVAFLEAGYPYDQSRGPLPLLVALDRTGDFNYDGEPLLEFLASISRRFGIPIVLASKHLEEAAISPETPITSKMSGVSLRTFLRGALGEYGLTYTLEPEGMVITTPEDAGSRLISLLYPVHDLIDHDSPEDSERLLEVIMAAVAPDTWEDVGGSGSVQVISGGWLLVWQMQEEHEHLLEFLNQLRHDVPRASRPQPELTQHEQSKRRIQSLLCGPAILDFELLPLDEFAAALQRRLGVPVVLSRGGLEEAGIDPKAIYICLDPQVQLIWRQLDEALQVYGLSFCVRDDCIQITSEDDAGNPLEREIVDVRDLTVLGSGVASEQFLIRLILHSVDLNTWDDLGGPGAIDSFKGCLIIHQDRPSLFEIREFLSWLRAHRSELPTQTEIALLDKNGQEYRRLVALCNSSPDRWLAVYLRCILNPEPLVAPSNQPLVPPWGSGGGIF